jgi:hypothetical protein
MITMSLHWRPGEKDKTEKWAPLSSWKMIYFFSSIGLPWGSSTSMQRNAKWTGGQDPLIHRRWHLAFHLEIGALRHPVVTFPERAGLSPGLFPLKHSLQKCPCCPPCLWYRPQLGGGSNEVMSLIFSLCYWCPGYSIQTWLVVLVDPMTFLL